MIERWRKFKIEWNDWFDRLVASRASPCNAVVVGAKLGPIESLTTQSVTTCSQSSRESHCLLL